MMKTYTLLLVMLFLLLRVYAREDSNPSLQSVGFVFQENKGQIRDQHGQVRQDIDFVLKSPGMTLFVGKGQLHYQFMKPGGQKGTSVQPVLSPQATVRAGATVPITVSRIDVSLIGSDKNAKVLKDESQEAVYHYYTSNTGIEGVTGVPGYKKITYKDIYPNIDWVLYLNDGKLKYDFIVSPGGKVSDIQLQYDGANTLRLQSDGGLNVTTSSGSLEEEAPYAYEAQSKQAVATQFILNENIATFKVDPYQGTLVIDPGVEWATYYGGAAFGSTISSDNAGHIYISGITTSLSNIATVGSYQEIFAGGERDAFLAKFDTLGQLQWATYYGGGEGSDPGFCVGCELSAGVTTDNFGHVYVYGTTVSSNGIATAGSFQDTINPVADWQQLVEIFPGFNILQWRGRQNGFLAQFSGDGLRQWATYYGADIAGFNSAACDKWGNVYAVGRTDSAATPAGLITSGTHQTTFGGPFNNGPYPGSDGLMAKFDSNGNRLWATYYGGEENDYIHSVICDDSNGVYIGGQTYSSTGIASADAFQDSVHPGDVGFLAKINGNNGQRIWGTYIDGIVYSLALDSFNHLYLSGGLDGGADLQDIATPGTFMPEHIGNSFLMQFNPLTGLRNWGTYYGGDGDYDGPRSLVACDPSGNVYLAGQTRSFGSAFYTIATPGSHQDTLNTTVTVDPPHDAFVAQFDSSGQRKWATYYGGPNSEAGSGITCDATGAVYIVGSTSSGSGIATPGSYQDSLVGAGNGFIVRFLPVDIALNDVVHPINDTACTGLVSLSVLVNNQGRMDKEDTLHIRLNYTGPAAGSADTFFTNDLIAGTSDTFVLNSLALQLPGTYQFIIYLDYTRDDSERGNDTLTYELQVIDAVPEADIHVVNVGTEFRFSNNSHHPNYSYFWDFGDGHTSTEANPTHEYAVTDSYLVTLIVTTPCGSDTSTISVAGIGTGSGIDGIDRKDVITVYPNPTNGNLYIKTDDGVLLREYIVVNLFGQTLLRGALRQTKVVDVSNMVSGSYFIRIRTDNGWSNIPFQVLRQ